MLTPAYAMNPHNMGHHTRTCRDEFCSKEFTCFKTSKRAKCDSCYEDHDEKYCGRCAGTGQFITQICNDVPTGPGGMCFRCRGKGYQTSEDMRRNAYYDEHRPVSF